MTVETTPDRRRAFVVIGVAIGVLILIVISISATGAMGPTERDSSAHQASAIALDLEVPGDVEIVASGGETIVVERRIRDFWNRVSVQEYVEDDVLHLRSRCGADWFPFLDTCRVDYVIHAPTETAVSGSGRNSNIDMTGLEAPVDVHSRNGHVSLSQVRGDVRLSTRNGRIQVSDVTGNVDLDTRNGAVSVRDVSASSIEVVSHNGNIELEATEGNLRLETRNGRVDLTDSAASHIVARSHNGNVIMALASSPDLIAAESRNGRIEIDLPADAPAYAIDMHTRNGSTRVDGVVNDPSSPFTINAETRNGNIRIGTR